MKEYLELRIKELKNRVSNLHLIRASLLTEPESVNKLNSNYILIMCAKSNITELENALEHLYSLVP